MGRRYAEPITVRCSAPDTAGSAEVSDPAWFVWRRRNYRVLEVAARWIEVGFWWRAARTAEEEYDLWRVEARSERQRQTGQYDVCRHRGSGQWFLVRAFD